jgi:hypothetical protein
MNTSNSAPIFESPQIALLQIATGYWLTQSIYVATQLSIPDLLKDGAKHCKELAAATNTHSDSLYRLLRALSSVGIFAETEYRCFELTPIAASLQRDVPGSMRAFAIMMGEEQYQAWGQLIHSIKTGSNAFEHLYGTHIFQNYTQNPSKGQIFDQAMTDVSVAENTAVLEAYDFSSIRNLVEVGGGNGSFLAAILQKNQTMKGVLLEQPYVIPEAQNLLKITGVIKRCELIGGDFFESVPGGADAYVLKRTLVDWDNERAIKILERCHQAMEEQGRLLVIEQVIPPESDPLRSKLLDLHMLVTSPGGRERTKAEYQELLSSTGFKITNIISTSSNVSVIEAKKLS